jgi:hypothetical protein
MLIFFFVHQHAAVFEDPNDISVRIEDVFTDELRHAGFLRQAAAIIDWRQIGSPFFRPNA